MDNSRFLHKMLNSAVSYKVNELQFDEFGRINGILAVNKPVGITSHDVVAQLRKILNTRKIGHAGALDPFASGVLITLIGKATKLANKFIDSDKEYLCTLLFGINTDSGDPEGKILKHDFEAANQVTADALVNVFSNFQPGYEQFVPVYSSIKVNGQKLRVLARQTDNHEVIQEGDKRFALFHKGEASETSSTLKVEIPSHYRKIPEIELEELGHTNLSETVFYKQIPKDVSLPSATIRVSCSKGTYIRTLAEDIGAALPIPTPTVLIGLERSRVDRIPLKHTLTLEEVKHRYATKANSL